MLYGLAANLCRLPPLPRTIRRVARLPHPPHACVMQIANAGNADRRVRGAGRRLVDHSTGWIKSLATIGATLPEASPQFAQEKTVSLKVDSEGAGGDPS